MSSRQQVEEDAALAQRLQEEEIAPRMGRMRDRSPLASPHHGPNANRGPIHVRSSQYDGPRFGRNMADHHRSNQHHIPHEYPQPQNHNSHWNQFHRNQQPNLSRHPERAFGNQDQHARDIDAPLHPNYPFARGGPEANAHDMLGSILQSVHLPFWSDRFRNDALSGLDTLPPGSSGRNSQRTGRAFGNGGGDATHNVYGGNGGNPMRSMIGDVLSMMRGTASAAGTGGSSADGGGSRGTGFQSGSFMLGPGGAIHFETVMGGGGAAPPGTRGGERGAQRGDGAGPTGMPQDAVWRFVSEMLDEQGPDMVGIQGHLEEFMQSAMSNMGDGRETYEDMISLIERMGGNVNRSATEDEISRLPTKTVDTQMKDKRTSGRDAGGASSSSAGAGSSSSKAGASSSEGDDKCAICLGQYEEGEEIKTLPCLHMYHSECVDQWLKVNRTCPFCKQSIRESDQHA